ncbi:MAG: tRNA (N6-threonylcarbamoyladenosine(37)-N6)-methyltransferase TrmO [Desulfobulbus propionicus]|nr:MAG: tRNA (N6-threonylcarbamoyladenosine(37)-N6)-methyltransferase TrmO [Desulfobulbus propionicus]
MDITIPFTQIGIIHSSIDSPENAPIQPKGAADIVGEAEVYPQFAAGLQDLEGFSHIYLLYHCHKAKRMELVVTPFMDTVERGVFATRSPLRPNHIGLSIVEVIGVKDNIVHIKGVDIIDQTPLLDIKPYIHNFDAVSQSRSGWMVADEAEVSKKRSDDRFV